MNNLAKSFHDIRQAWSKSALEKTYKVIYCDAIYINVRCDWYMLRKQYPWLILESSPNKAAAIWDDTLVG